MPCISNVHDLLFLVDYNLLENKIHVSLQPYYLNIVSSR